MEASFHTMCPNSFLYSTAKSRPTPAKGILSSIVHDRGCESKGAALERSTAALPAPHGTGCYFHS